MNAEAPLLEVNDLGCGRLWARLSFVLRAGGMLQITGANGAGKTTLIRVLCGLANPDCGEVLWRRQNIFAAADDYRADLLYVGHRDGIKNELTPMENLSFAAALHDSPPLMTPQAALQKVGIQNGDKPCGQLSAGQKRRTALARLLINRATIWFLDEPLTALDDDGREMLGGLVSAHLADGGAAVVATHQQLPEWSSAQTMRLEKQ